MDKLSSNHSARSRFFTSSTKPTITELGSSMNILSELKNENISLYPAGSSRLMAIVN